MLASNQIQLASLLGVEIVTGHEKYLGLPTYLGRAKTEAFAYLKERMGKRLTDWQVKLLSIAGRDILIRVVGLSLLNYAMSYFLLTQGFCDDFQQLSSHFWRGSTHDKRKIHWTSWDTLCLPKEEGTWCRI